MIIAMLLDDKIVNYKKCIINNKIKICIYCIFCFFKEGGEGVGGSARKVGFLS